MFNGGTNSLLKEPTDNYIDVLKSKAAKYYCQYKIFYNVLLKMPIDRYKKEQIISSKIEMSALKSSKISTKFILIHKIMTNIMNATTCNVKKLVCWIPLGFEKTNNSPNNNMGITMFTFTRGMIAADVQQAISANAMIAIGSRQLLIDSYDIVPKFSSFIEKKLKKNIDVVITLANIIDNTIKVDEGYGGMYYKMNVPYPYPYYVWGMTLDNCAHICYNVAHTSCNIEELVKITHGQIVTDKYVFSLNKNCNI